MTDPAAPNAWPPDVTDAFVTALIQAAPHGRESLFLEVGTGSGRITRPLLERGVRLVGLDLSWAKLERLRTPGGGGLPALVQADAVRLPFASASFDAIVAIHVLHLIEGWPAALGEFRRLLRPGGVYLCRQEDEPDEKPATRLRSLWGALLAERGLPQRHGSRALAALDATLQGMGGSCRSVQTGCQQRETSLVDEIARLADRARAGTWSVPEERLPALLAELARRVETQVGPLDQAVFSQEAFVLQIWRF